MRNEKTKLSDAQEQEFRAWYNGYATITGMNPNPDAPQHYYDYRGWWKTGDIPSIEELMRNPDVHGDSRFKMPGHPRQFVQSVLGALDTTTGKIVDKSVLKKFAPQEEF